HKAMGLTKLNLCAAVSFLAAGAGWAAHHALQEKPAPEQREDRPQPAAKNAHAPKADEGNQAKKDYYGDPLPPGALARMGTVQLRQPYADVRFSADGKTLTAAGGDGMIGYWDVS